MVLPMRGTAVVSLIANAIYCGTLMTNRSVTAQYSMGYSLLHQIDQISFEAKYFSALYGVIV